jgi:MFS transporter, DHA1 family, inner membrane transport protein
VVRADSDAVSAVACLCPPLERFAVFSPSRLSPARRALLVLALGSFGLATGEFVTLGLLPEMAGNLDVSIPRAGWLISAYALGVVVGAPLLTAVSVRLPRKGLLVGLALALAVGNVLSALAPGFGLVLAARFLAGLPHGAYFGVASVVAAGMVREHRRSQAMAVVFAGLTVANIVGVPLTTMIGQASSWRLVYGLVAVVEVLAAALIAVVVPVFRTTQTPRLRAELSAFRNKQVWLSLGVATIGGGAMFASFSYIAPMMTHLAGYAAGSITWLLVLFGVGMTAGNLVGARLADRNLMRTVYLAMSLEIVVAASFFLTAHHKISAAVTIVLFPFTASMMLPAIQSRLVTLAGGAPNLAAASMHSAFNIANSIGAWLGGVVIAAGYGYGSPNLVAAGLAAIGLMIALFSGRLERTDALVPHPHPKVPVSL